MTMYSYSYTTMHTYDKANQLVSSTTNGKVTEYAYDAAGRLIKEGDKSYAYGWLDKVLSVTENGQQIASFNYHNDGQIAQAIHNGKSEDFLWDGLALIHRGETSFINEPYVTGGNPILSSKDGVMFNDMLGSTLNIGGKAVNMTAFGESADTNAMYTGKPYIGELGYAFLFRNYRSDYGKWQTTDPLGYPDGWNNLAYCGNSPVELYDFLGALAEQSANGSQPVYRITLCVDGGPGGGSSSSGGSSNSSASNYGHGWVVLEENVNGVGKSEAIGFYPSTSPGVGAIWGQSYPGKLSNDANRPSGYVTMTFDLTKEQYDAAKNRIDTNWRAKEDQTTPNWQLSNNCMNFMLDVFDATGKSSEIDTSSWRTNGWLDPRKGYTWMLQNGGKIKE